MSWIVRHHRSWRMIVLIFLIIAFIGPWTGDRINVPGEYACSLPYLRTGDDMCNMIGAVGVATAVSRLLSTWTTGAIENSGLIQTLPILGSFLLAALTLFTTLLFVLTGTRHHKICILFLAITVSLLIAVYRPFPPSWMWGARIYIIVAIVALVFEIVALHTDKASIGRTRIPSL